MANYEIVVPFIKKWEGGFSKDPYDPAAKNLPPELQGVHTNAGVTWGTYKTVARPVLGVDPTPFHFMNLTDQEWGLILKKRFWDKIRGDSIKSQIIANALSDYYWHSGHNAVKSMQKVLNEHFDQNLKIDGVLGPISLRSINLVSSDIALFSLYMIERFNFINYIISKNRRLERFRKGWYNRMSDLIKFSL